MLVLVWWLFLLLVGRFGFFSLCQKHSEKRKSRKKSLCSSGLGVAC